MTLPASGEQHEIRHGSHVAIATEVGATLRSYTVEGEDVVDGFTSDERSPSGRGQILAPWPNRLDRGRYAFEGRNGSAALDEPEAGNAIHGLVRWLPWRMAARTDDSVTLDCILHPQPGYPWRLELGVTYRVDDDGLAVTAWATNRSVVASPFGIGFHPYLTIGSDVDDARLTLPAAKRLLTDPRGLPVGEVLVGDTEYDFRQGVAIGSTKLDTAYTELARDGDGRVRVRIAGPDGARGVTLWAEPAFEYVMAYTGDTLQPVARRRRSIALEPMTCPPNALTSGVGVIRLEPGASWTGAWGISPGTEANVVAGS